MNLVCVGISHHTAPLEVRERLWFSQEEIQQALSHLKAMNVVEAVLFSTCNRTELYVFLKEQGVQIQPFKEFLIRQKSAGDHVKASQLFSYFAGNAVDHLLRVASGIDSMVIGDVQVLAQVKEGLHLATEARTAGFFMNKLFQTALHAGKRSRAETRIGEGAVSVSYAAVDLAQKIFDNLEKKTALVIGAGETAELTAKHLRGCNIGTLYITNRTAERANLVARKVGGKVLPFEEYCDRLSEFDIIISSVQAEGYILTRDDIARVDRHRHSGALFIFDIGVPRNIDPAAGNLDNVFLHDLDSLQELVHDNIQKRERETTHVQAILTEDLQEFQKWHATLEANPTIAALTDLAEVIRKEEVDKNINRFSGHDRELLDMVTRRIVNKILHQPIVHLKNGNDETITERLQKISVVRKLFGLRPRGEEEKLGG